MKNAKTAIILEPLKPIPAGHARRADRRPERAYWGRLLAGLGLTAAMLAHASSANAMPAPPPPRAEIVGQAGSRTLCYWVYAESSEKSNAEGPPGKITDLSTKTVGQYVVQGATLNAYGAGDSVVQDLTANLYGGNREGRDEGGSLLRTFITRSLREGGTATLVRNAPPGSRYLEYSGQKAMIALGAKPSFQGTERQKRLLSASVNHSRSNPSSPLAATSLRAAGWHRLPRKRSRWFSKKPPLLAKTTSSSGGWHRNER